MSTHTNIGICASHLHDLPHRILLTRKSYFILGWTFFNFFLQILSQEVRFNPDKVILGLTSKNSKIQFRSKGSFVTTFIVTQKAATPTKFRWIFNLNKMSAIYEGSHNSKITKVVDMALPLKIDIKKVNQAPLSLGQSLTWICCWVCWIEI